MADGASPVGLLWVPTYLVRLGALGPLPVTLYPYSRRSLRPRPARARGFGPDYPVTDIQFSHGIVGSVLDPSFGRVATRVVHGLGQQLLNTFL